MLPETETRDVTAIRRARTLARLLDNAFAIPGTRIRVGLDPILGLIPGGGDVASAVLAAYIVLAAIRTGAPPVVVWRMLGNMGVDTVLGSVPIIGDAFDVAYKSNVRNVALLESYAATPGKTTQRSKWLAALVILILILFLIGVATVAVLSVKALLSLF